MKKEKKKMDKFTGYRNEPVGETEQEHQGWKKCGDVGMRSRDAGLSSGANKGGGVSDYFWDANPFFEADSLKNFIL